jgi:hypothetical protein
MMIDVRCVMWVVGCVVGRVFDMCVCDVCVCDVRDVRDVGDAGVVCVMCDVRCAMCNETAMYV